jgi:hypothetical protein
MMIEDAIDNYSENNFTIRLGNRFEILSYKNLLSLNLPNKTFNKFISKIEENKITNVSISTQGRYFDDEENFYWYKINGNNNTKLQKLCDRLIIKLEDSRKLKELTTEYPSLIKCSEELISKNKTAKICNFNLSIEVNNQSVEVITNKFFKKLKEDLKKFINDKIKMIFYVISILWLVGLIWPYILDVFNFMKKIFE